MSNWREAFVEHVPQQIKTQHEAAILQSAAMNFLRQEHDAHMTTQRTLWNTVTGFLARRGVLAYEAPNYDLPHFTTGYMALTGIDIDDYRGKTLPLPCIKIASHDHDLIWNYFSKEAHNPWRMLFPGTPEKQQKRILAKIHEVHDVDDVASSFPSYIELEAAKVTLKGRYKARVPRSMSPAIRGSYVPQVSIGEEKLPIFPSAPPPNYRPTYGYTNSWVRLGPPKMPSLYLSAYDTHIHQSLDEYTSKTADSVAALLEKRDRDITNMAQFMDIVQTADQVGVSVYKHYENIARS